MPGSMIPRRMAEHELNVIYGGGPYALMYIAPMSADNDVEDFNQGAGAYLDDNGEFRVGYQENAVTIFLMQAAGQFDAEADVGNLTGGTYSGIPSLGDYEVFTTEFVAGVYNPNDYLMIEGTGDDIGLVTQAVPYVDTICGIVSAGVGTTEFKKSVLQFWTYHLPVATEAGTETPSATLTPTEVVTPTATPTPTPTEIATPTATASEVL